MGGTGLSTTRLRHFLTGVEFPAAQEVLVQQAKENGADQGTLEALSQIPSRTYESIAEVMTAFDKLP